MTSQSDDDYSNDPEQHQGDDNLLTDLVMNPNAEGTNEGIVQSHNDDDQPSTNLPNCQNTTPSFDNSGNTDRYVSRFRDAQFMRELQALLNTYPSTSAGHTLSVITPHHSFPLIASSSVLPSIPSLDAFFNHTSPYTPWWETNGGGQLPPPARQYRTPAPWRDTSEYLVVSYRHLALRSFGPVHTLTLNLSPDIEIKARAQAYPLGWIQKRIADQLKKALGRTVEFHLVLEEAEGHRLHVHGELQISADEAKDARAALRKAGGQWEDEAPQFQAQAKPDPDRGWLDYILLDLGRISFTREFLPRYTHPSGKLPDDAITFAGSPIASTAGLNAAAAKLYDQHRQAVMAF